MEFLRIKQAALRIQTKDSYNMTAILMQKHIGNPAKTNFAIQLFQDSITINYIDHKEPYTIPPPPARPTKPLLSKTVLQFETSTMPVAQIKPPSISTFHIALKSQHDRNKINLYKSAAEQVLKFQIIAQQSYVSIYRRSERSTIIGIYIKPKKAVKLNKKLLQAVLARHPAAIESEEKYFSQLNQLQHRVKSLKIKAFPSLPKIKVDDITQQIRSLYKVQNNHFKHNSQSPPPVRLSQNELLYHECLNSAALSMDYFNSKAQKCRKRKISYDLEERFRGNEKMVQDISKTMIFLFKNYPRLQRYFKDRLGNLESMQYNFLRFLTMKNYKSQAKKLEQIHAGLNITPLDYDIFTEMYIRVMRVNDLEEDYIQTIKKRLHMVKPAIINRQNTIKIVQLPNNHIQYGPSLGTR